MSGAVAGLSKAVSCPDPRCGQCRGGGHGLSVSVHPTMAVAVLPGTGSSWHAGGTGARDGVPGVLCGLLYCCCHRGPWRRGFWSCWGCEVTPEQGLCVGPPECLAGGTWAFVSTVAGKFLGLPSTSGAISALARRVLGAGLSSQRGVGVTPAWHGGVCCSGGTLCCCYTLRGGCSCSHPAVPMGRGTPSGCCAPTQSSPA